VFSKYFQDELGYLRELGKEFAQRHPGLAPMLADQGSDTDVERLLEGVAFLTGRVRQKLDDELPEVFLALSELLFPHLVRPLPGATILELTPLSSALRERRSIPRGTEFASTPVEGTVCQFRSCSDVDVAPWSIQHVALESVPGGKQQLRIVFQVPDGVPVASLVGQAVRFHVAGDVRTAFGLVMKLCDGLSDVVVALETTPSMSGNTPERHLGKRAVKAVGFDDEEALLPYADTAFPGYRLVEEYYTLPRKFAFFDVKGLEAVDELGAGITAFSLLFRFDAPLTGIGDIGPANIRLHCVPVVNLFATSSEPIRLDPGREKFLITPSGLSTGRGEVYSVERVTALSRGKSDRQELPWFFDFAQTEAYRAGAKLHYVTHLEPAVLGDGADLYISVGSAENAPPQERPDLLSLDIIATNGALASAIRPGEIRVPTATTPPFITFSNLSPVTRYVPPPMGKELQWRAVAHAAMNLRTLTDVEVLRSILLVYNLHGLVDRQAARANELRVSSIKDVRVRPAERIYHGAPIRGLAIEIDIDENGFVGDGDVYLFGAVLDRLFGAYVPINAFAQTTVVGTRSNARYTWPPRSGTTLV
jgi:type VI secretion system protein ImpG